MLPPVTVTVALPVLEVTVNGPIVEPAGALDVVGVIVRLGGDGAGSGPSARM